MANRKGLESDCLTPNPGSTISLLDNLKQITQQFGFLTCEPESP